MPGKNKKDNTQKTSAHEGRTMVCSNLSFAASEAYKMLRTNLLFTLTNDKKCNIIGITSSTSGEGKSVTAANLSYTIAETGRRVLTIEADLRLPTIYKRLNIEPTPGLSNLLVGLANGREVLKDSGYYDNWKVITAGDIPPNPSELLGSERMRVTIETLAKDFDFIIIDLPPVNIVTDALVISSLTDGFIMIVRQDVTDRKALADAMAKLKLAGAKVLGFVMTGTDNNGRKYRKYGKYGTRYGSSYSYGRSYYSMAASADAETAQKSGRGKHRNTSPASSGK